jgi:hypothetical protein
MRRSIKDAALLDFLEATSLSLPRSAARALLGLTAEMGLGQQRLVGPGVGETRVELDDHVFTRLPGDTGHFGEPYFEHVLRGLRTQPPEYVEAALGGLPMADLGPQMEGIAGLVIIDEDRLIER